MPFLILIVCGVIIVLLISIWNKVFVSSHNADARVYFVEGSGAFKPWGTDVYVETSDASLIKQGDELRVNYNSKGMVEFFDGTIMRIGEESEVLFDVMTDDDRKKEIEVKLISGEVWINRAYNAPDSESTELVIDEDLRVNAGGASVFTVQKKMIIRLGL